MGCLKLTYQPEYSPLFIEKSVNRAKNVAQGFITTDPLKDDYPYYSSYQYAGNKPINNIDLDGLEPNPETDTGGQGGSVRKQVYDQDHAQHGPADKNLKPGDLQKVDGLWYEVGENRSLKLLDYKITGIASGFNAEEYQAGFDAGAIEHMSFGLISEEGMNISFFGESSGLYVDEGGNLRLDIKSYGAAYEEASDYQRGFNDAILVLATAEMLSGLVEAAPSLSKLIKTTADVPNVKLSGLGEKLSVADYKTAAKNSIKDNLTPDHIPSRAAIQKNIEKSLGRPLRSDEARKLLEEGTTILYETNLHQSSSRTFGGRNTRSLIELDAKNLFKAAESDMQAIKDVLIRSGVSEDQVNQAFQQIHRLNKQRGLY